MARHHPQDAGVLCRYFFQHMMVEDDAPAEEYMSSLLLSSEPTLDELRRKFPFEGQYHFRLQHLLGGSGAGKPSSYCWIDLSEPNHVLPVTTKNAQREIRVKVLQLSHEPLEAETAEKQREKGNWDQVDVPEDRQFAAYFGSQNPGNAREFHLSEGTFSGQHQQQQQQQDVSSVLSGVKKALASKMKQSNAMAQTIQKKSAKMWEKVVSGSSGGSLNAPPTAAALAQLAKLVGAMKAPLYESNRDHVDLLNRLWVTCYDAQPLTLRGAGWELFGFRYDDPLRELQFVLPLQCLVFFHEVHRNVALPILQDQTTPGPDSYPFALVGAKVSFLVADLLQLKDGACLGSERPFWRLFEDPMAFFELFSIAFRAFDQSWKMNASKSSDIGVHLEYVAEFVQELLLRRSPDTVPALVEYAHQMQDW